MGWFNELKREQFEEQKSQKKKQKREKQVLSIPDLTEPEKLVKVKIEFGRKNLSEPWNIVRITSPTGKTVEYIPKWDDRIAECLKKAQYTASRYNYPIEQPVSRKGLFQAFALATNQIFKQ